MKTLKLMLICALQLVPVIAHAREAQTVEELIQMYDSTSCKACHQKIYED